MDLQTDPQGNFYFAKAAPVKSGGRGFDHIAANSGAGLRDLMARMGHDSERAAMIYQHEARGADKAITDAIDKHVDDEHRQADDGDDGLAGVPVPA